MHAKPQNSTWLTVTLEETSRMQHTVQLFELNCKQGWCKKRRTTLDLLRRPSVVGGCRLFSQGLVKKPFHPNVAYTLPNQPRSLGENDAKIDTQQHFQVTAIHRGKNIFITQISKIYNFVKILKQHNHKTKYQFTTNNF
ncbi:hypothetical protein Tsp_06929 [Trichinella spiralis]|uniref:hypothetical protein n=1 Tax=Trichinella spiralis TaxID=6334 RepID=UPI0001EFCE05|nr:hypothetical protein Tsp_06929 [Trichinella spiralis]